MSTDDQPGPMQRPPDTIVLEIATPANVTTEDLARISIAISKICHADSGHAVFYQRVPADVDVTELLHYLTSAGLPVRGIRRSPRL